MFPSEISRRQEGNPELLVDLPLNEADQTIEEGYNVEIIFFNSIINLNILLL